MSLFYYPYPSVAPLTDEPILVEINARIVPLIISAVERYKYPQFWQTELDFISGVQQLEALQEAILTGTTQIVEAIDRLYRLVDTSYNGTQYTATANPADPDGPPLVSPAIPGAPPWTTNQANAMRAHLGRSTWLLENLISGLAAPEGAWIASFPGLPDTRPIRDVLRDMQGITGAGWFGIGGRPATLADLLRAGRANDEADRDAIQDAISQIENNQGGEEALPGLLRTILDLFGNTATDGGLAAIQIASIVANMSVASGQLVAMRRVIDELALLNRGLQGTAAGLLDPPAERENILNTALYTFMSISEGNGVTLGLAPLMRALLGDPVDGPTNVQLAGARSLLGLIASRLVSENGDINVADSTLATQAAVLQLYGALGAPVAGVTANQQLDAIRRAIRSLAGLEAAGVTVTGSALAALLEELECICNAVSTTEPPDDPGLNQPPAGACVEIGIPVRCVGWELKGTRTISGEQFDILMPIFLTEGTQLNRINNSGTTSYYSLNEITTIRFCLSWNFTGGTLPLDFCRDMGASPSIGSSTSYGCTTPFTPQSGVRNEDITRTLSTSPIWVWNFRFPRGYMPPNNVFLVFGELS